MRSGLTAARLCRRSPCRKATSDDESSRTRVTAGRELVEAAMRAAVERLDPRMRRVAAYHFGWVEADGSPPKGRAGGKALRPALALLSGRAAGADRRAWSRRGGGGVRPRLLAAARRRHGRRPRCAGTARRPGRSSASRPRSWPATRCWRWPRRCCWTRGTRRAHRAARPLAAATRKLIAGQAHDLAFEPRTDVTLDECTAMAPDKTAALFACSCSIGAVLAGAPTGWRWRCPRSAKTWGWPSSSSTTCWASGASRR